jgi:hypothetical protein
MHLHVLACVPNESMMSAVSRRRVNRGCYWFISSVYQSMEAGHVLLHNAWGGVVVEDVTHRVCLNVEDMSQ